MADLSEHEAEIFSLLSNGWVAVHTVRREFRINNGPPEDMASSNGLLQPALLPSLQSALTLQQCT